MKLLKDNEWQKRAQRLRTSPIDGPDDPRTRWSRGRSISSSSHDTTVSSKLVKQQPQKPQSGFPSSGCEEDEDSEDVERRMGVSDYRLASASASRRSVARVNFSSYTQNFPAVVYPGDDSRQRIGDRTTAFDGVEEAVRTSESSARVQGRAKDDGVRNRIQKFEESVESPQERKRRKKRSKAVSGSLQV